MYNNYNKQIAIPFSKGKILLFLLLCASMIALSLWDLYTGGHPRKWDPTLWKILTSIIIMFSFLGFVLFFIKLFDKRPGLVIDEEGFVNNTPLKSQHIRWKNITGFAVWKYKGAKMLLVYVNNPEESIANESRFRRFWLRKSIKTYGTPYSIISTTLQVNFRELLDIIRQYSPEANAMIEEL